MADAARIKEFLVALGFQIDQGSYNKFDRAMAGATRAAVTLGTTIAVTAAAVVLNAYWTEPTT